MTTVPCDAIVALVPTLRRAQRTVVSHAGVPPVGASRVRDSGAQPGDTTTVSHLADRHWPLSDIILPIRSERGEPSPLSPGTIIAAHVAASHRSLEDGDRLARC